MRPQSTYLAPAGAEANNQFAFDLYSRLVEPGRNLCFSPSSIGIALAMVHAGARGETAHQIESVLHLPSGQTLGPARIEGSALKIANAIWAHDGYPVRPEYTQRLADCYDAEIRSVDFKTEAEPARKIINDWVGRKTNGKIPSLIDPPLGPRTRLILTNAIYFLAKWLAPFDPSMTLPEPFHIRPGKSAQAPMMHRKSFAPYVETDQYRATSIAYEPGPAMWVILPREGISLEGVEANLTAADFAKARANAGRNRQVLLSMPRFRVRGKFDLAAALVALGMPLAFSDNADFTGMHEVVSDEEPLQISSVIHESFTDVNEERTEAAAATAVVMRAGGKASETPPPPVEFNLDRPFLFMICEWFPSTILFMGRVVDPTREM